MKHLILLLTVYFFISLNASCNKEDPESYEVRKREHRLFRCKVDGKEWTYTGKEYWGLIPHIRSAYYEEDSSLYIEAYYIPDPKTTNQYVRVSIKRGLKLGENLLDWRHTEINGGFVRKGTIGYNQKYYMDILDIDTLNHIIVGTFEFKARDAIITEGEFDLKMDAWVKEK